MKKHDSNVAIFTFIKANNYGAMLQAYALGKFLEGNGYTPIYIDIDLRKKHNGIKGWLRWLILNFQFNKFRKKQFTLVSENKINSYDILIYGSDQIWNTEIVKEDLIKFSGGLSSPTAKKISYAASFGVDVINKEDYKGFENNLKSFTNIMVRESSAVELLKNEFNINSKQVLDPTFLIDNYQDIAKSTKNSGISCYLFSKLNKDYNSLEKFSNNVNEKLYFLNQTKSEIGIAIPFPSVENWLSIVINSKYVITDSFHCMVMAIIHKINFYVVSARADRFVRISSLLESLGLEDRILKSISVLSDSKFNYEDIDYNLVNKRLNLKKEYSRESLLSSIKDKF